MYSHLVVKIIYKLYRLQLDVDVQPWCAVLSPDSATLAVYHALSDSQSQSKTVAARPGGAESGEGPEDGRQIILGHARTLIGNAKPPVVALFRSVQADLAVCRRVPNGIAQDVLHGLSQPIQVAKYPATIREP